MFKRRTMTVNGSKKLTTVIDSDLVLTEQIKTLRTNIDFVATDYDLKTLMVTSATLGEGKSTVSTNLAVEYANEGLKVLLVDANLRRPAVHKIFGINNQVGLSSWLGHQVKDVNKTIHPVISNLLIMPSGPTPPNPAELLGSQLMASFLKAAKEQFGVIIVDAPAVLPVTDTQLLATKIDGTVLVVRQNVVQKAAVRDAVSSLKRSHTTILGAVLNDVRSKHRQNEYYGYGEGY